MVSPTKPSAVNTTDASYSAVPNPEVASPELNNLGVSPDLNNRDSYISPEGTNTPILGRDSMYMPAPSMISRDSTHESLLRPGTPGNNRDSWASGAGLAAGAAGLAGDRRPGVSRGQSNLQHSSVGWNNTSNDRLSVSDEDEEQGHIAPAAAAGAGAGAGAAALSEKPAWAHDGESRPKKSRKWLWIGLGILALLAIGLAVGLGVGLTRGDKSKHTAPSSANDNAGAAASGGSASHSGSATGSGTTAAPTPIATSGIRGSLITLDDGSEVTYDNPFGGKWVWDPSNPFNNEAQAQSYTPPLNQNWTWGVDKIYGVNLGGWLNTEPFIVPALYEIYATGANGQTAVDEYTLSQNMGDNLTAAMTEHYETFITERDFIEIASAGLNWIRLPVAHWAVSTSSEEPYLERVSWTYVLKALGWARKYGIRVNLDLHTLPGSQNGWNHSGKIGSINWMNGAMGLANAQRALDVLRTLAQFASQPEWAPVIGMFGFNEPNAGQIGQRAVGSFYHEMHDMVRQITGYGEGHGPMLTIHDGFIGITSWYNFLPGADRISIDQHPYMIFGDQPMGSQTLAQVARQPCSIWAEQTNQTSIQYGVNSAGEWSAAPNDCGLWVNSVGGGSRYDGTHADYIGRGVGSCDYWNDWTQWDQATKDNMLTLVSASMDALQNFFFWTWKIGNSTGPIAEVNPFWHYRLGLREGWVPKDPRTVAGTCASFGVDGAPFDGTFSEGYMTGGPGAGTIAAADSSSYPWPPASFTNVPAGQMTDLPQYTQTADPITMPGPTYTSPGSTATFDAGSGWFNSNNARQAYAPISGCSYPPEYSAANLGVPANACGAGQTQPTRRDAMPEPLVILPTPAPKR